MELSFAKLLTFFDVYNIIIAYMQFFFKTIYKGGNKMNLPRTEELFDLSHTQAAELLSSGSEPYDVLSRIKEHCERLISGLGSDYREIADGVFAAEDAEIAKTATLHGPAVIGHKTELRAGAFIRGSVIIGDGAVIGNSTEIKNSIIFDEAALPHYNYVGDSIIGYKGHLGAGVIVSNFRLDGKSIRIKCDGAKLDTGLRKMGVLLGDFTEVGSNSVIYPGSIIGKRCVIYPLSRVYGVIGDEHYYYGEGMIQKRRYDL